MEAREASVCHREHSRHIAIMMNSDSFIQSRSTPACVSFDLLFDKKTSKLASTTLASLSHSGIE